MALDCDGLAADIIKDCENKASGGLETNVVIIRRVDIDYATSVYDKATGTITSLATKSGTTGYSLEGMNQVFGASSELVPKETSFDKHKHLFKGVVLTPSTANKLSANNMTDDLHVIVVEKLYKGVAQADAFEVLGWQRGLKISAMVWNSQENDGTISFEASSIDGYEEDTLPINLIETDYATTKTAFDAKFATA